MSHYFHITILQEIAAEHYGIQDDEPWWKTPLEKLWCKWGRRGWQWGYSPGDRRGEEHAKGQWMAMMEHHLNRWQWKQQWKRFMMQGMPQGQQLQDGGGVGDASDHWRGRWWNRHPHWRQLRRHRWQAMEQYNNDLTRDAERGRKQQWREMTREWTRWNLRDRVQQPAGQITGQITDSVIKEDDTQPDEADHTRWE